MQFILLRNIFKVRVRPIRMLYCSTNGIPCNYASHRVIPFYSSARLCSTQNPSETPQKPKKSGPTQLPDSPVTLQQKLKKAVAEYGSTVIIFHVGISLISLGIFYALVSSGLDVEKFMAFLGMKGDTATKAGTFAMAYAVHKVFAPVRLMITLTATPFIVQYLRRVGILKKIKQKGA